MLQKTIARQELRAKKTVVVIDLGHVGLPLALLADRKGHRVIGIEQDHVKAELLAKRQSPLQEEKYGPQLQSSAFQVTQEWSSIRGAEVIVVCTPTPVFDNGKRDLEPFRQALLAIGSHIRPNQLVIIESTINPGVCDRLVIPTLEQTSGLRAGVHFHVAHCPQRINQGDQNWTLENTPRVIGATDELGLRKALEFYSSIVSADIRPMISLKEAEAVKVVENAFRDVNIAFVNELALSFAHLGIDIMNVIEGAATKPFSFMAHYPGCGVGGHCVPNDSSQIIDCGKEYGFDHDLLSAARRINSQMPRYAVLQAILGMNYKKLSINGSVVTVLGLAYKPEIDDTRDSPALEIVDLLQQYGAIVRTYDPYAKRKSTHHTLASAVRGSAAVIVATAHQDFRDLRPDFFREHGVSVVVDGRNCLRKEDFANSTIFYRGIGR